jgi:hypothetical protein
MHSPIILNILPNVYWMYNNPEKILKQTEYNIELQKQSEKLGIKSLLELDDKLSFWHKSRQYINDIKIEMEKNEFAKLLAILTKLNDIVKNAYLSNTPLLISTYKQDYLELGLSIWIYFFNINANISFDNVIKLMAIKMIGNITLSDELKKFFAFMNLKQIGTPKI